MFETALALLDWLAMIAQWIIIPAGVTFVLISKFWAQVNSSKEKEGANDWLGFGKFAIGVAAMGIIAFVVFGVIRDIIPAIGSTAQSSIGF